MQIREVNSINSTDFSEAMKLYSDNFSPDIAHPISYFEENFNQGHSRLFIGKKEDKDEIIVFAITYQLSDIRFLLLDYYAVRKDYRDKGFGSQFLATLFNHLKLNEKDRFLLIEIEDFANIEKSDGFNVEQARKRTKFYKQLGVAQIEGVKYFFPHFEINNYSCMVLMIYPKPPSEDVFNQEILKKVITELFIDKYNRRWDDLYLKRTLESIPSKIKYI